MKIYTVRFFAMVAMATGLPATAQLTPEQKVIDFQTIASVYAKQYAPYEWKRDNFGFDLFNLRPWMDKARQSKNDLEYLEVVSEYIGSLRDVHSYYVANSDFFADLHLFTDIYDGKVLIESIDRSYLPVSRFDFAIGDEVVQFEGRPVMDVVNEIGKTNSFGNPRSTARWAADFLVFRPQVYLPSAAALGDTATLLVRKQDGSERSYTIAWDKGGSPLSKLGPVPNFQMRKKPTRVDRGGTAEPDAAEEPRYRKAWLALQNQIAKKELNLRGYASRNPYYRMPDGFVVRLGRLQSDFFFSGTYSSGGKRIGFIRIGTFQPVTFSLLAAPLRQFEQEIAFMKANTDVLVVDVARNEGGYGCYAEAVAQYVIPKKFGVVLNEIRATLDWVNAFRAAVADAEDFGEEWEVNLYSAILRDVETAYSENRGRTGPLPICSPLIEVEPARDSAGALLAYDKPLLLLTDEFTTSAGDSFAAMLQDAGVKLFGYRTAGAGGSVSAVTAGFYSEGAVSVTQTMLVRPEMRQSPGFPASRYLENAGVQPDSVYDYQTRDNLINAGKGFTDAFTAAAVALTGGN